MNSRTPSPANYGSTSAGTDRGGTSDILRGHVQHAIGSATSSRSGILGIGASGGHSGSSYPHFHSLNHQTVGSHSTVASMGGPGPRNLRRTPPVPPANRGNSSKKKGSNDTAISSSSSSVGGGNAHGNISNDNSSATKSSGKKTSGNNQDGGLTVQQSLRSNAGAPNFVASYAGVVLHGSVEKAYSVASSCSSCNSFTPSGHARQAHGANSLASNINDSPAQISSPTDSHDPSLSPVAPRPPLSGSLESAHQAPPTPTTAIPGAIATAETVKEAAQETSLDTPKGEKVTGIDYTKAGKPKQPQ